MGDDLSPSTAGLPSMFAAPSNQSPNNFAPMGPTRAALFAHARDISAKTTSLRDVLVSLDRAASQFSGALCAVKAIAGIADAMDDTCTYRTVGTLLSNPEMQPKLGVLRHHADALRDGFTGKVGTKIDPRKYVPKLDGAVHGTATDLWNLIGDPSYVPVVQAVWDDKTIDATTKHWDLWCYNQLVAIALELLARVPEYADQVFQLAQQVHENKDTETSVPAVAIAAAKSVWPAFVSGAQVVTGSVGNLPGGTDSLSIALLKIYAAHKLPKAALGNRAGLEDTLFNMLVGAISLTDEQKADLDRRMAELKKSQADVIDSTKEEAATRGRLPDHQARIARKTRKRLAAEEDCRAKAENVSAFYKEAYGPENQELFASLQRSHFMDGLVNVLTIIQLIGAFEELDDPDVSTFQKIADVSVNGLLTLGAGVSLVNRCLNPAGGSAAENALQDVGILKSELAAADKMFQAMGANFAIFGGVMAIITGTMQCLDGLDHQNTERAVVGGFTATSGALIVFGTLWASAVVTGFGVGIGVLLAAYALWGSLEQQIKPKTQVAIEGLISGLEQNTIWESKTAVEHLGLKDRLDDVKQAVSDYCILLIQNPAGDPTRAALIARMESLGFDPKDATAFVESADEETGRRNPSTVHTPTVRR